MSEQFVSSVINSLQPSNRVALDIGANMGIYTAQLAPKFKKVYAVEAHPENAKQLAQNLKNFNNIEIVNKAINTTNDPVILNINPHNHGGHSINSRVASHKEWGFTDSIKIEVPGITLDEFTKDMDVGFAKFDIEGAEDFIFLGATEFLKRRNLNIVIEVHNEVDRPRLFKLFKDNGFAIWGLGLVIASAGTRFETVLVEEFSVDSHFLLSKN